MIVALVLIAAVSWTLTDDRMGGMDAGPGTELGGVGWFLVAWVTMMAAMMIPSVAPVVMMYARINEGRGAAEPLPGGTAIFVAGYLASWAAAGLLGYMIFDAVRSLELEFLAWSEAGRYVAGAVIVGAAVYQLTPLKDTCLHYCRTPLALVGRWRRVPPGRLRWASSTAVSASAAAGR